MEILFTTWLCVTLASGQRNKITYCIKDSWTSNVAGKQLEIVGKTEKRQRALIILMFFFDFRRGLHENGHRNG